MSLTAAVSGFVVFLLSVQGTVHLHLYCKVFRYTEEGCFSVNQNI